MSEKELLEVLTELEAAGSKVLAGLEARIDRAARQYDGTPVFTGIADLHDALHRARAAIASLPRHPAC